SVVVAEVVRLQGGLASPKSHDFGYTPHRFYHFPPCRGTLPWPASPRTLAPRTLLMRYLLSAFLVLLVAGLAAAAAKRPNVVFIRADALGWGDVGFNGRTDWKTPPLDKLASQGTNFKRWYPAAVVCAPSRAALMTGKYGIHNGVSGNSDALPA